MNEIHKLIQKFCSNGVEFKRLDEIFNTKNGYTPSKSNSNYWNGNTCIPWFRMEDIRERGNILIDSIQHVTPEAIKGELFPENSIIVATSATIGEHALVKVKSLANQKFTYLVLKKEYQCYYDIKFLYYYCYKLDEWCLTHLNQSSFASVDMEKFYAFTFPVPPLAAQREIVRILDNFTELTTELAARKKQYEYYRDSLLEFDISIPKVKLRDIATDIYRGSGITREQVTEDGIPCVRYGEIYTTYHIWFEECQSHTKLENIVNPKYFEHGDILFAITGENIEDIAKSTAYMGYDKCLAGGDIVVLKHNQNPKYLSYILSTYNAQKQKSKGKMKSKVVHSSVPSIEEIEIPLPTLEVQNRLVNILDNFDAICTDLNIGLPAEIEARKKQYEYYRNMLLTFVEDKNIIFSQPASQPASQP